MLAWVTHSCTSKDDTADLPSAPVTLEQKLQKALNSAISRNGGKGASLAVILPDGETILCAGGISHPGTPVETGMVFSAGSITKMFTAALILKYQEAGILSLEDSAGKWLPPFENIDGSVTIRQLLNHTGGIYNFTESVSLWDAIFAEPGTIWTMDEVISNYILVPYFEAGSGWHYSNTGYVMLRMIIEEISGSTVAAEYRKHLLEPAGLINMFCAIEEPLPGKSAHGWIDLDGNGYYDDFTADYFKSFYSIAGGGIFCSAGDLARWTRLLLHDQTVIKKESLTMMKEYRRPTPGEDLVDGYGLGLYKFNKDMVNGLEVIGHGGNPVGYAAGAFYLEEYGICMAIMDNTEHGLTMNGLQDIFSVLIDHVSK